MSEKQVEWKWSNGEKYEKSSKQVKNSENAIEACLNDNTMYDEIIDLSFRQASIAFSEFFT